MGFDWEDTLGGTSYEDAVYMASKFFEHTNDVEDICCDDFLDKDEEEDDDADEERISEYMTGEWNGQNIRFKRVWAKHVFTDDEVERLLNGETIKVRGENKLGKGFNVSGSLAECEYEKHKYVGFTPAYKR